MSTSPKRPCLRNTTPIPTPYLNKHEPLVDSLGILYLLTNGYINLPSTGTPVPESGFGYGKHKTPAVAYRQFKKTGIKAAAGKVVLSVEEEYYIHPIFSRERWEIQELASRSMPHWDTLKPVWQLATLMLEEKSMSGFLCGMLDQTKHVELKDKHNGQKLYSFEAKKNPTQEELWELWESLWNLKDVITFGVLENSDDLDRMTFGETVIQLKKPGLTPSGAGSRIVINEDILSMICSKTKPRDYSLVKQIDEVSCLLRLHFQLATTLVHELVHALWNAVFGTALEPFYRDHRYAEVGWTYECLLAGGAISAIGHRVTSTYGLKIQDWPGIGQRPPSDFPERPVPGSQAPAQYAFYPVPMKWLPKHFTQLFWDDVDRFGIPAFNCPRPGTFVETQ